MVLRVLRAGSTVQAIQAGGKGECLACRPKRVKEIEMEIERGELLRWEDAQ